MGWFCTIPLFGRDPRGYPPGDPRDSTPSGPSGIPPPGPSGYPPLGTLGTLRIPLLSPDLGRDPRGYPPLRRDPPEGTLGYPPLRRDPRGPPGIFGGVILGVVEFRSGRFSEWSNFDLLKSGYFLSLREFQFLRHVLKTKIGYRSSFRYLIPDRTDPLLTKQNVWTKSGRCTPDSVTKQLFGPI